MEMQAEVITRTLRLLLLAADLAVDVAVCHSLPGDGEDAQQAGDASDEKMDAAGDVG
jgi:hypothetical protein